MRSKTPKITMMDSNWNCMDVLRGGGGTASEIKRNNNQGYRSIQTCVYPVKARFLPGFNPGPAHAWQRRGE